MCVRVYRAVISANCSKCELMCMTLLVSDFAFAFDVAVAVAIAIAIA